LLFWKEAGRVYSHINYLGNINQKTADYDRTRKA
jgi:hypothetical protein